MTLICGFNLQSNPPASITWKDPNNRTVANNSDYSIDDGPKIVQLIINNVTKSDSGFWRCIIQSGSKIQGKADQDMPKIFEIKLTVVSKLSLHIGCYTDLVLIQCAFY